MSQIGNRDNENYRTQDFPDGSANLKAGHHLLLPSATKLRRLCFYTCLSVHRGVCLSECWDTTPPGPGIPHDQAPPNQATPRTRHPLGPGIPRDQAPPRTRHPPGPGTPQQTAAAANGTDGTHHGMYSCSVNVLRKLHEIERNYTGRGWSSLVPFI